MGGFEPPTSRLTADCSAVELHWNVYIITYLTFLVKYQFYYTTECKKCNNKNEGHIAPPNSIITLHIHTVNGVIHPFQALSTGLEPVPKALGKPRSVQLS